MTPTQGPTPITNPASQDASQEPTGTIDKGLLRVLLTPRDPRWDPLVAEPT